MMRKYWWKDDTENGVYYFCYNEAGDYNFYISEGDVSYVNSYTELEHQHHFKGAKFVWDGCADGCSYSDRIMLSDNIEDAKREFEAWYENYLDGRIAELEKALTAANDEYECFLLYQKAN